MKKEKELSWQAWTLLILWASMGMVLGVLAELALGLWILYPVAGLMCGLVLLGIVKRWVFNIELVTETKIIGEEPK